MQWEALQTPFNYGAQGSKILVTTRSEKVASAMQSNEIHHLGELQEEHCWQMFAKLAFHDADPDSKPEFKEIGKRIVEKCKGLPLALKTIGGLLRKESSALKWKSILTSEIWELPEADSNIIPALRLSYLHLPSHLKRCFAYCSIFPKDYRFYKGNLILLWMAENFLQCPQQSKGMEEVGEEYFNDLLSRSFFQQSSGDETCFVMHDLLNDLAKYVSGDFCFRLEVEEAQSISKMARHFSYTRNFNDASKWLDHLFEATRLRTFLPFLYSGQISSTLIHDLLSRFKCIRVLSISRYGNVIELPDSIGNLKHLRYLDLSYTSVKKLPDSTCLLYNLQTLKLNNCQFLVELPDSIGNLKHLRYLDLFDTSVKKLPDSTCLLYNLQTLQLNNCGYLEELPLNLHQLTNLRHLDFSRTEVRKMPMHMGQLKNLQVLSSFYVGRGSESNIQQLGELNLHGALSILELQNIVSPSEASAANLKNKEHLVKLHFEWSEDHDESQNERKVLENLQPSGLLKELSIANYGGTLFPDWFGDNSLSNVVSLTLRNCKYCVTLPPLGLLPFLKKLLIKGLDAIVWIGLEFYGSSSSNISFASLESLTFRHMKEWELWECTNVSGSFPRLRWLKIRDCPKLKGHLPEQLLSLKELGIFNCQQLVASIPWAPAIDEIRLMNCQKLQQFDYHTSTVKFLDIGGCDMEGPLLERIWHIISDTYVGDLYISHSRNMSISMSHCYHFLVALRITSSCDSLRTFPLDLFPKLDTLSLEGCSNLETISFPQEHGSLTRLDIHRCPKFVSFPRGGFSASKLEKLDISVLNNLKSLPENMNILLPSLRDLRIHGCPQLESFPQEHGSLTSLNIASCPKFVSFPRGGFSAPKLEKLDIYILENLKSLPENMHILLPSLTDLHISYCSQLELFFPQELCSLTSLKILVCPKFVSFPRGGFSAPKLEKLDISGLENLKSLPANMHILLPSLTDLHIRYCPQLESFGDGGLPSSLKYLTLHVCSMLIASLKWALQTANSLGHLSIGDANMESFPDQELLPPTLTSLRIENCPNLKKLDYRGLCHLSSLRELKIDNCPKLERLPEEGLPNSISTLTIDRCPWLSRHCKNGKGEDWGKIAHIECVKIDVDTGLF